MLPNPELAIRENPAALCLSASPQLRTPECLAQRYHLHAGKRELRDVSPGVPAVGPSIAHDHGPLIEGSLMTLRVFNPYSHQKCCHCGIVRVDIDIVSPVRWAYWLPIAWG